MFMFTNAYKPVCNIQICPILIIFDHFWSFSTYFMIYTCSQTPINQYVNLQMSKNDLFWHGTPCQNIPFLNLICRFYCLCTFGFVHFMHVLICVYYWLCHFGHFLTLYFAIISKIIQIWSFSTSKIQIRHPNHVTGAQIHAHLVSYAHLICVYYCMCPNMCHSVDQKEYRRTVYYTLYMHVDLCLLLYVSK